MKVKSILAKAIVTVLAVSGLLAVNAAKADSVQAATVKNDTKVVTVNYVEGNSIRVWNSYKHPEATKQVLPSDSSWKVIKTAYDKKGHKWYDLGKNQWVKAKYVNKGYYPENAGEETTNGAGGAIESNVNYTTNNQSYGASSASEAEAQAWIASRESGGSYSAQNGQYIGKYQLSASYLNGDYSAANQERVANNYVMQRYGSWVAAKSFWQANGWY